MGTKQPPTCCPHTSPSVLLLRQPPVCLSARAADQTWPGTVAVDAAFERAALRRESQTRARSGGRRVPMLAKIEYGLENSLFLAPIAPQDISGRKDEQTLEPTRKNRPCEIHRRNHAIYLIGDLRFLSVSDISLKHFKIGNQVRHHVTH